MRLIAYGLVLTVFAFPCWGATIIVDQNGSGDFTNIQDAINYSWDGDTVVVLPGTYSQAFKFNGRRITLTSLNSDDENIVKSTIIQTTVTFDFGEASDSIITGLTIKGRIDCTFNEATGTGAMPTILKNRISNPDKLGVSFCAGIISKNIISNCGIGIQTNNGIICNNVIVSCTGTIGWGIDLYCITKGKQVVVVKNNIIAYNRYGVVLNQHALEDDVICKNSYNCFWNNGVNDYVLVNPGLGDFKRDPLFADSDYHIKSSAGRWSGTEWVLDDANSPCIDKGDPNDPIGVEPNPNGGRINIGAYGGTIHASKSPTGIVQLVCTAPIVGDLNGDCKVDYEDFALTASHWLECNLDPPSACW